jgi:hypothetical protein
VWVDGADGPSHDFELLEAPRVGERVSISVGDETEDGIVDSVTWQLQAISGAAGSLEGEPAGSVTIVHVICHSRAAKPNEGAARAEEPREAAAPR